jgi:hypothetical protein
MLGMTQTMPATGHTHITPANTMMLATHINGGTATMMFTLANESSHTHTITLTQAQVDTLRGGGSVTMVVSTEVNTHTHTYTIECGA